jgi:hypothetical protein
VGDIIIENNLYAEHFLNSQGDGGGGVAFKSRSSLWALKPVRVDKICVVWGVYANGDGGLCFECFYDYHTKLNY